MKRRTANSAREPELPAATLWRNWSFDVYPSGRILIENRSFPGQKY